MKYRILLPGVITARGISYSCSSKKVDFDIDGPNDTSYKSPPDARLMAKSLTGRFFSLRAANDVSVGFE